MNFCAFLEDMLCVPLDFWSSGSDCSHVQHYGGYLNRLGTEICASQLLFLCKLQREDAIISAFPDILFQGLLADRLVSKSGTIQGNN